MPSKKFSAIIISSLVNASILAVMACAFSGCGNQPDVNEDKGNAPTPITSTFTGKRTQCYGVVNGALTGDYPEVVLLARQEGDFIVSRCTGTFVSETTAITAAHCVANTETGNILALIEDCSSGQKPYLVDSTKVIHHGYTAADFAAAEKNQAKDGGDIFKLDLAVLTFPAGTATSFRALATKPAIWGDEVHFIGYGIPYAPDHKRADDNVEFGDIKKREGRNTITEDAMAYATASSNIGILFNRNIALGEEPGTYSVIAQGDSGGPLFVRDNLVGVTSAGSIIEIEGETYDIGFFTDLHSPDSFKLLKKAAAAGAVMEGFQAYSESFE